MTKITIGTLIDTVTITKERYDRLIRNEKELARMLYNAIDFGHDEEAWEWLSSNNYLDGDGVWRYSEDCK
jgi:hypothetical protein